MLDLLTDTPVVQLKRDVPRRMGKVKTDGTALDGAALLSATGDTVGEQRASQRVPWP